jgi:hypothetical protein
MRNISFMLTTPQFIARTKTVTRRMGWSFLKPGDRLCGVYKSQGLRKGESLQRLGTIEVTSIRREPLNAIDQQDCVLEGFPEMTPAEFVEFFCLSHKGCSPETEITRIGFVYV